MAKPLGPNFGRELTLAGLGGLPISWSADGTITGYSNLTQQQKTAIDALVDAHDPARPAVPLALTRRQFFQALGSMGVISAIEAEEAAVGRTVPDKLLIPINALPSDQKYIARMHVRSATEFRRDHPLVIQFAAAQTPPWTTEQVDDLWRFGATL